jgi:hypothetical protein
MSTDDSVNILLIDGIDKDRQYYAQRLTVISPDYQILEAANGRVRVSEDREVSETGIGASNVQYGSSSS